MVCACCVTRRVLVFILAAAQAAQQPAWPPPMTRTSQAMERWQMSLEMSMMVARNIIIYAWHLQHPSQLISVKHTPNNTHYHHQQQTIALLLPYYCPTIVILLPYYCHILFIRLLFTQCYQFISLTHSYQYHNGMSSQESEVFKLTKQLQLAQHEHQRDRTLLLQKIELLSSQVAEYQEKQLKNKQLNESIMLTYRQNESFRDQLNQRQLESITQNHHYQLASIKHKHQQQRKQYQQQLNLLRAQNQKLRLQADQNQLDHQKAIAELRRDYEQKQQHQQNDLNVLFNHKLAIVTEKLKQAEEMAQLYREQLQLRTRQSWQSECESQLKGSVGQQLGKRRKLESGEGVSALQMRINRALVQLNPKQGQLQQRMREIKFKIY